VLILCYECSKEISDKASVCPACGAPRGKGWFKDYYEDSPLRREGGHHRGQRDGKYKEYFENGEVAVLGEYSSGKRIGIWTSFHDNGSVWKIRQFEEAENSESMIGEYRENYDNGQIHEKVSWKDDRRHGPYEEYDKEGELRSKGVFCLDQKCGSWVEDNDHVNYKPCSKDQQEMPEEMDH
jgi:antitoxin component YwqK of YwqJK toxin-antitoxin module